MSLLSFSCLIALATISSTMIWGVLMFLFRHLFSCLHFCRGSILSWPGGKWSREKALCQSRVCVCVCVYFLSHVWLFATHQALLSVEFPGQEYWSGLPFLTPGGLPDPGIEPVSLASPALAGGFFTTAPPGKLQSRILGACSFEIKQTSRRFFSCIRLLEGQFCCWGCSCGKEKEQGLYCSASLDPVETESTSPGVLPSEEGSLMVPRSQFSHWIHSLTW